MGNVGKNLTTKQYNSGEFLTVNEQLVGLEVEVSLNNIFLVNLWNMISRFELFVKYLMYWKYTGEKERALSKGNKGRCAHHIS